MGKSPGNPAEVEKQQKEIREEKILSRSLERIVKNFKTVGSTVEPNGSKRQNSSLSCLFNLSYSLRWLGRFSYFQINSFSTQFILGFHRIKIKSMFFIDITWDFQYSSFSKNKILNKKSYKNDSTVGSEKYEKKSWEKSSFIKNYMQIVLCSQKAKQTFSSLNFLLLLIIPLSQSAHTTRMGETFNFLFRFSWRCHNRNIFLLFARGAGVVKRKVPVFRILLSSNATSN